MPRIDVKVVNPFLTGVKDVLGTMAQVTAQPGKPYIKKGNEARGVVSGVITLSGEREGTIALSFGERTACEIAGRLIGEPCRTVTDEVCDAVGELTNMISGRARQGLAKAGASYKAGIPKIVYGSNHTIEHCCDGPILGLGFSTMFGEITVEVCFSDKHETIVSNHKG